MLIFWLENPLNCHLLLNPHSLDFCGKSDIRFAFICCFWPAFNDHYANANLNICSINNTTSAKIDFDFVQLSINDLMTYWPIKILVQLLCGVGWLKKRCLFMGKVYLKAFCILIEAMAIKSLYHVQLTQFPSCHE